MDELISKRMAIDTFKDCAENGVGIDGTVDALESSPSAQPKINCSEIPNSSDDTISRQAAIDEANAWLLDCLKVNKQDRSCGLIRRLEDLPTAQPKRGKWNRLDMDTFNCNKCGATFVLNQGSEKMHFCPNCGADMRGEQE